MDSVDAVIFLFYYGDHTIRLELAANEKAKKLKSYLMRKTGLLSEQMELLGWDVPDEIAETITFADVAIMKEHHIVLQALNGTDAESEKASQTYHLQLRFATTMEVFDLYVNGLQTVREIRQHVARLSSLPYDQQQWTGWPATVSDDQFVADIDIPKAGHQLQLSHLLEPGTEDSAAISTSTVAPLESEAGNIEDESSYYDVDWSVVDDVFEDSLFACRRPTRGSLLPTIAHTVPPSAETVTLFRKNFENRYGETHVNFFKGSLVDAMMAAFDKPIRSHRLFLIYLHNDKSICVNTFVLTILQNKQVIDYLTEQEAVVWPYDVTEVQSRMSVGKEMEKFIGHKQTGRILSADNDCFPMLLLFAMKQECDAVYLVKIIDGSKTAEEVMDTLQTVKELYDSASKRADRMEVHEIDQFLYLSGASGARRDHIRQRGITCIINCTVEFPNLPLDNIEFVNVRIDDSPYALIGKYFDFCADKVEEHRRNGGKVLVHCMAGVSRSASIILAYLVRHGGMTLRDAYYLVRKRRSIIRPNVGFWKQLIEYELHVRKEQSVKMVPSSFGFLPDVYEEEIKPLSWVAIKTGYRI